LAVSAAWPWALAICCEKFDSVAWNGNVEVPKPVDGE